jgi:hypothetical protein
MRTLNYVVAARRPSECILCTKREKAGNRDAIGRGCQDRLTAIAAVGHHHLCDRCVATVVDSEPWVGAFCFLFFCKGWVKLVAGSCSLWSTDRTTIKSRVTQDRDTKRGFATFRLLGQSLDLLLSLDEAEECACRGGRARGGAAPRTSQPCG